MGNSQEKSKDSGGSSDGCIGERRMRTFLIGGFLCAFGILSIVYYADAVDAFKQLVDLCQAFGGLVDCSTFETFHTAYLVQAIACGVIIGAAAAAAILHCVKCDGGIETVVGWILVVGGAAFLIGAIIVMTKYQDLGGTDSAYIMVLIGEAILPSVTAIILGLDVVMNMMEQESKRLFLNLVNLAVVSGFCLIGYSDRAAQKNPLTNESLCGTCAIIATGYSIIMVTCIVYCVLNLCDCITCNCDDNPCVRVIIAIALIVGGVFTCIGYYTIISDYAGNDSTKSIWGYYVGYTVLIGGLCATWAIDMGLVDGMKSAGAGGAKTTK